MHQEGPVSARVHNLTRLLQVPSGLPPGLPQIHHDYDFFGYQNSQFSVHGWAISQDEQWTSAIAYINGIEIGRCSPKERPDVRAALPHFAYADHCQFSFSTEQQGIGLDTTDRLDIVFYAGESPLAAIWTPIRSDLSQVVPVPPLHLMKRVIGTDLTHAYLQFALTCMGQYVTAISRAMDISRVTRLLDWGCGCGRVTSHYLLIQDGPEVCGCDIDAEDIAWCQSNLPGGRFDATEPYPPLPYEKNSFDAIVSLSVLTHLTKRQQLDWLAEIDRVMAPGGVFVASVLGPWGADRQHDRFFAERISKEDFFDDVHDPVLDGIAPKGYYRATYQRESYTRAAFGKFFDVVDYIEGGVGIQDLVVAKKKARAGGVLGWLRGL